MNIMLSENNSIITESESVAKIFNKYFDETAEGIGFNDPIPENFDNDDILLSMIMGIKILYSRIVIWFSSCYSEWYKVLCCEYRL